MKSFILLTTIALSGIFFSGCNKQKDTTAKIVVRDSTNALVIGATVHITASPTITGHTMNATVDQTQPTDYKGEAFFNYNDIFKRGQAGVAVLDIDCSLGAKTGSGIIKIEQETENTATVYIQ